MCRSHEKGKIVSYSVGSSDINFKDFALATVLGSLQVLLSIPIYCTSRCLVYSFLYFQDFFADKANKAKDS